MLAALPGSLALPARRRVPGHEPRPIPVGPAARRKRTEPGRGRRRRPEHLLAGAAPTCATSSTSSATTPMRPSSSWSRTTARRSSSSTPPTPSCRRNEGRKDKKLWTENPRGVLIERFEADSRGRGGRVDRAPGGGARRRPRRRRLGAGAPRRRGRRAPLPAARHRGHVPHQRAEPSDRGSVPALRPALPAGRRHALLPAPRGQGRAGLPARAAQRPRRGGLRAHHQRARRAASARRPSQPLRELAAGRERQRLGRR